MVKRGSFSRLRLSIKKVCVMGLNTIACTTVSAVVGTGVLGINGLVLYTCQLLFGWNTFSLVLNIPHVLEVMLCGNTILSVSQIALLYGQHFLTNAKGLGFDPHSTQEAIKIGKLTGIFGAFGGTMGYIFTFLIPSVNLTDFLITGKPTTFVVLSVSVATSYVACELINYHAAKPAEGHASNYCLYLPEDLECQALLDIAQSKLAGCRYNSINNHIEDIMDDIEPDNNDDPLSLDRLGKLMVIDRDKIRNCTNHFNVNFEDVEAQNLIQRGPSLSPKSVY